MAKEDRVPLIVYCVESEPEEDVNEEEKDNQKKKEEEGKRKPSVLLRGRAAKLKPKEKTAVEDGGGLLLNECGKCGRYMLDIDGNGEALAVVPGPYGITPISCPGCRQTHADWSIATLLDESGSQRETIRQVPPKHSNSRSTNRTYAPEPTLLQALLCERVATNDADSQRAVQGHRPAKWTLTPHTYDAWCRRKDKSSPCDYTCTSHHYYHPRRMISVLTERHHKHAFPALLRSFS